MSALNLVWQTVWEKENSYFNLVKLCFKIDQVMNPAHVEAFG